MRLRSSFIIHQLWLAYNLKGLSFACNSNKVEPPSLCLLSLTTSFLPPFLLLSINPS